MSKFKDYIFDIECYKNFFCIVVTDTDDNEKVYRLGDRLQFLRDYDKKESRLFGFNSKHYDNPMLQGWLAGYNVVELKRLSDELFKYDAFARYTNIDNYNKLANNDYKFKTADLFKLIGKVNGLKMLGIIIGHKKLEELPYSPSKVLTPEEKENVIEYCRNDVRITKKLYDIVNAGGTKMVKTRASVTTNDTFYDAGITNAYEIGTPNLAEESLRAEYLKKYKIDLKGRTEVNSTKGTHRSKLEVKDLIPQGLTFEHKEFTEVYEKFNNRVINFVKDESGKFKPCEFSKESILATDCRGTSYAFGNGGGHSAQDRFYYDTLPDGKIIINSDFGSYYPNLIIQRKLNQGHFKEGFLYKYYEDTIEERFHWKKQIGIHPEAKSKSDGLKLKLNAGFGKIIDPNSFMYDAKVGFSITTSGQMYLMKLVDMYYSSTDAKVINFNTDGVAVIVSAEFKDEILKCNREMERLCGIELEEEYYQRWIQKSCNAYLAIDTDGKMKGKGGEFSLNYDLEKGMSTAKIIPIAFAEYFKSGTSFEDTIHHHDMIQEFLLASKKSINTYDVLHGGEQVSNINRYYKSTEGKDLRFHNRDDGKKPLIPKGESVTLLNDIRSHYIIPKDLDYDYYIDATYNMLLNVRYGYDNKSGIPSGDVIKMFENRYHAVLFARMSGLPIRASHVRVDGYKSPSTKVESEWLDNLEECSTLYIKLGDGLHLVTIEGGEQKLVYSDKLKHTKTLRGSDGKMFNDERGFTVESKGWYPIWGIASGKIHDFEFSKVLTQDDEFTKTIECMFESACKLYNYKVKSTDKTFITLSQGKYETDGLETLAFNNGQGVIDYFSNLEFLTCSKDDAGMVNLWKHDDDRAIAENCVSTSGLMLDIDGGCTIQEMCEMFKSWRYVYYTSASHTEELHKFRFIIPFKEAISKHEYNGFKKSIKEVLGGMIDASSTAVGRRFYLPTKGVTDGVIGSKPKGKYFKLSDLFESEEITEERVENTNKDGLGAMWFDFILPDLLGRFENQFYINNRHQAVLELATVMYRNGYTPEEVFDEIKELDCMVTRSKYSDSDIIKKLVDVYKREY